MEDTRTLLPASNPFPGQDPLVHYKVRQAGQHSNVLAWTLNSRRLAVHNTGHQTQSAPSTAAVSGGWLVGSDASPLCFVILPSLLFCTSLDVPGLRHSNTGKTTSANNRPCHDVLIPQWSSMCSATFSFVKCSSNSKSHLFWFNIHNHSFCYSLWANCG